MKLKFIKLVLSALILISGFDSFSQKATPLPTLDKEVNESLELAGNNRKELEKVLSLYSKEPLKFKAACFIINQLKWHQKTYSKLKVDENLFALLNLADSLYYNYSKGKPLETLKDTKNAEIAKIASTVQQFKAKFAYKEPQVIPSNGTSSELSNISSDFLINHIENGFLLREKSKYVKSLSFEEFCDYTLGYHILDSFFCEYNGKSLSTFFKKYLGDINNTSPILAVEKYNTTISNFRKILGPYPLKNMSGFEDLFFSKVPGANCYSIATYGNSILNAYGLPTSIFYNIAYKQFQGQHSSCIFSPSMGIWSAFNPESSLPRQVSGPFDSYGDNMNLYRIHFSEQHTSPFFLKKEDEFVPENLNTPLIEDITSTFLKTVSLTFPFEEKTTNNLAYLETFDSQKGTIAVTWGIIDKSKSLVTFKNAILDRMYFATFYDGTEQKLFSKPFYLKSDSLQKSGYKIIPLGNDEEKKWNSVIITKKFPEKAKFKEIAKNLVGTVILGFNDNKEKKDTLYTINHVLEPYFQDINLNNKKAYKNYRIQAPSTFPHLYISEIQFLTEKSYNYQNICPPTPLPSFNRQDKQKTDLVRLLQKDLDALKKIPEYDGNLQTAPSAYPNVTYTVSSPQVVSTIRLAPVNTENGIDINDKYVLLYWDKGQWNKHGDVIIAKENFIEFTNLPKNRIYWIKNLSKGKEEMPFLLDANKNQVFIY